MSEPKPTTDFQQIDFRNACGSFATGVTIITTRDGETDHGMTANAFMSISLDPPMVAISIAKTAKMLGYIRNAQRFAVSILPTHTQELALHFAGRPNESIREPLKENDDLPVARDACMFCTTHVTHEVEAGDHIIFVGQVSSLYHDTQADPLLFHRGRFSKLHDEERTRRVEMEMALWEGGHW